MLNKKEIDILTAMKKSIGADQMYLVGSASTLETLVSLRVYSPSEAREMVNDIDVVIRNPKMTTEALEIVIQAVILSMEGISVTVTKETNSVYSNVSRRFRIRCEGCKNIDLICVSNYIVKEPLEVWEEANNVALSALTVLEVTFEGLSVLKPELSLEEIKAACVRDSSNRTLKVLKRAARISEKIKEYKLAQ